MRKILILFVLAFIAVTSFGQTIDGRTYTPFNNYYRWKGGIFDSTLLLPDGIPVTGRRPGAVRYNAADSAIYLWTGSQWRTVTPPNPTPTLQQVTTAGNTSTNSIIVNGVGSQAIITKDNITSINTGNNKYAQLDPFGYLGLGNGTYDSYLGNANVTNPLVTLEFPNKPTGAYTIATTSDTVSLSGRINAKVNISDTASMLSSYLRKVDTLSLSSRINTKLNISDTSSMLTPYARTNTVNAGLATKVNISDTATMLTQYLRKVDTASLSSRIDLRVRYTDTATMLSPYLNSNVAAATYQLILDTIPLAVFGAGSGAASDTAAFTTSAVYGSFYNAGNDTLIITQMRAGVLGTSPNITTEVYWNDSLNVTAGATILVTGGTSVTGTIGATNVTSFTNNKIPPNNWVFVRTSAVATKPTYFTLTLLGYRKRQ
jgi:hypothetical protein